MSAGPKAAPRLSLAGSRGVAWSVTAKPLPVSQLVKNLPAMKETRVPSLGQEDSLEKGMTTCSSILAWRIPWTEESARHQLKRQRYNYKVLFLLYEVSATTKAFDYALRLLLLLLLSRFSRVRPCATP
ncbi:hypothetical protein MG293_001768 [Ovis ammon polii]|uniref:Uncharacterized protein n=1 Tax=Ovis ammon polii TaxID=230172 RepID=A0AAD4ULL5_OVIAM|nr:hypothetical protein MG293_001768 [Ovis ammon polii]